MKIFNSKKREVGILEIFRTKKTEVKLLEILRTCNSREALTTTRSSPLVRIQNNLRSLTFIALKLMSITALTLTTDIQENMEPG